jgi:lycopene cyclase domain-containing protein
MGDKRTDQYTYRDGKKQLYWIWWVVAAFAFVFATLPLVYKKIHWRAFWLATAVFFISMFVLENMAIHQGWWIWNDQKLWGIKILWVPLEEVLFYIPAVPAVVIIQILFEEFWARHLNSGR